MSQNDTVVVEFSEQVNGRSKLILSYVSSKETVLVGNISDAVDMMRLLGLCVCVLVLVFCGVSKARAALSGGLVLVCCRFSSKCLIEGRC